MHKKLYGIYSYSEGENGYPVFWNNETGWVDKKSATRFEGKKTDINLPMSKGNDANWCILED